jgi:hypothetical protein
VNDSATFANMLTGHGFTLQCRQSNELLQFSRNIRKSLVMVLKLENFVLYPPPLLLLATAVYKQKKKQQQ